MDRLKTLRTSSDSHLDLTQVGEQEYHSSETKTDWHIFIVNIRWAQQRSSRKPPNHQIRLLQTSLPREKSLSEREKELAQSQIKSIYRSILLIKQKCPASLPHLTYLKEREIPGNVENKIKQLTDYNCLLLTFLTHFIPWIPTLPFQRLNSLQYAWADWIFSLVAFILIANSFGEIIERKKIFFWLKRLLFWMKVFGFTRKREGKSRKGGEFIGALILRYLLGTLSLSLCCCMRVTENFWSLFLSYIWSRIRFVFAPPRYDREIQQLQLLIVSIDQ